jgi:hypothetical protein
MPPSLSRSSVSTGPGSLSAETTGITDPRALVREAARPLGRRTIGGDRLISSSHPVELGDKTAVVPLPRYAADRGCAA